MKPQAKQGLGSFQEGEGLRVPKARKSASDRVEKPLVSNRPKRMSVLEYARYRGVSEQRVRQLITGRKLTAKKVKRRLTLDPIDADREWENNVDHRSRPRSLGNARPTQAIPELTRPTDHATKEGDDADLDVVITEDNAAVQLRIAEAVREMWKAKQARLDYEEQIGHLVSADRVRRDAFEVARIVRDAVLALPDRLSPELIGITDQAAMHGAITKALVAALDELTNGIEKRFGIPSGVHGGDETGPASDGERVG